MQLGPPGPYGTPMRAWVANPTRVLQECPQWCWAASLSMIFAAFGRPVDQKWFVQAKYGGLACGTGTTIDMGTALSRSWPDGSGSTVSSTVTAAYDVFNGILAINNAIIINELANNRPLIYANKHHAMVVVAADYFATMAGPNIQSVGVLDPWPYSPGFHPLTQAELYPAHQGGDMTFLASVQVY